MPRSHAKFHQNWWCRFWEKRCQDTQGHSFIIIRIMVAYCMWNMKCLSTKLRGIFLHMLLQLCSWQLFRVAIILSTNHVFPPQKSTPLMLMYYFLLFQRSELFNQSLIFMTLSMSMINFLSIPEGTFFFN